MKTAWEKYKACYELASTAGGGCLTSIKYLVVCAIASGEATLGDNTLPKVWAQHLL